MDSSVFKHSFKVPFQESIGLAVYSCGFQKCEPNHSWGPAMRNHYLLHYISSGEGTYHDGTHTYQLKAGDIFLIVPTKVVSYCADQQNPWEYYWVGFNGADADRLMGPTGLTQANPVNNYGENDTIKSAMLDIYNANGTSTRSEARMIGGLYLFLATLMDFAEPFEDSASGGDYEYVEKALRFIQYNYSRNINVDEIAESAGISRSHLYRLFIKYMNIPPNEFLTRFRINEACQLLREHGLSVSEAAYSSGFNDQLYFSRIFKKYKNVPPSKYVRAKKLAKLQQEQEASQPK